MKKLLTAFLIFTPCIALANVCSNGFYSHEDQCIECPTGYSGSDGNRDDVTSCYVICNKQTISNGLSEPKQTKIYFQSTETPICEYDTYCDPGYYFTQNTNTVTSDTNINWVNPNIYLWGTGQQYIDTGVPGDNNNLKFEIKYEWVQIPAADSYHGIFGNYNGQEAANCTRLIQYGSTRTHINVNTAAENSNSINITKSPGVIYTDTLTAQQYTTQGGTTNLNAAPGTTNTSNILLFTQAPSKISNIKIYYFKIWDGDELIRYFVPVNKDMIVGNTHIESAGMWDIVNKQFYSNKGNGNFIYGGVIPECKVCIGAVYSPGGNTTECTPCPDGYDLDENEAKSAAEQCTTFCSSGTYIPYAGAPKCVDVGPGYWAEPMLTYYGTAGIRNQCPEGLTTSGYGAASNEASDCGKALHIGNSRIVFRSEPKTEHTLRALIDGVVYYGSMSPNLNTTNTINVKSDGVVYSLHDDNGTDSVSITNNKLLWVDENTYLESDGYQYIDTGVPGNNSALSFKIKYAWTVLPKGYEAIFANYESETANITRLLQSGANKTFVYVDTRTNSPMASIDMKRQINTPYVETLDFSSYGVANKTIKLSAPTAGTTNNKSILLLKGASSEHPKLKIYYFKVYDQGKLIRNFVPIYAGAQIGDYTVPANGMWDIVEQKFYPNSGTGNFKYGYGG